MRELNFWCAAIAQNFLLICLLFKIGRKLHKKHRFWKEKRKSMTLNGTNSVESAVQILVVQSQWAKLWITLTEYVLWTCKIVLGQQMHEKFACTMSQGWPYHNWLFNIELVIGSMVIQF